jgi:hypothetical protein
MTPLEQAKEAVRLSRDHTPKGGRRFNPAELDELGRLCKEAFFACQNANTTISAMRLLLWQEERQAFRAALLRGEVPAT